MIPMTKRAELKATLFALGILMLFPGCNRSSPPRPSTPSTSGVLHLTTDSFEGALGQEKPVLVDFWAPWCGPCRTQGPILEEAAAQIGDRAVVGKVNVDEEAALAKRFDIRAIPTLIVFRKGQEIQRFTGVQQAATLTSALEN